MNVDTGELYKSMQEALEAGEKQEDLVEVFADKFETLERLSSNVKMATKKKLTE